MDATDLRLLTEEDELQELQRQQEQEQQPAAEAEAAAQAGPLQPAEEGGSQAEEAPAEGSQHGTARLRKAPQQHADFVAGPTAKRARSALPQSSPGQSAERTAEAQTLLTTYQGMVKAMRERREVQRRLTAQTLRSAADPGAGAALLPQPPSSAAAGVATQAAGDGESTREVLMKRGLRRLAECAAEAQTAKPEERCVTAATAPPVRSVAACREKRCFVRRLAQPKAELGCVVALPASLQGEPWRGAAAGGGALPPRP